ncbi:MAG: Scr1 family TA system antitoxin-like transcriptional regulator [Sciscionella sp.]
MLGAGAGAEDVETRVTLRLGRRDALVRRKPAHLVALIGEPAIRQRIGGRTVMADQLRHLLTMADTSTVDLRVVRIGEHRHCRTSPQPPVTLRTGVSATKRQPGSGAAAA